jgi:hypothetical protein
MCYGISPWFMVIVIVWLACVPPTPGPSRQTQVFPNFNMYTNILHRNQYDQVHSLAPAQTRRRRMEVTPPLTPPWRTKNKDPKPAATTVCFCFARKMMCLIAISHLHRKAKAKRRYKARGKQLTAIMAR